MIEGCVDEFIVKWWFFFFFKQKTAYEILTCDWSSDVCSSDLYIIILFLSQLSVVVIITSRIITDYDDTVCSVRTGNEDI